MNGFEIMLCVAGLYGMNYCLAWLMETLMSSNPNAPRKWAITIAWLIFAMLILGFWDLFSGDVVRALPEQSGGADFVLALVISIAKLSIVFYPLYIIWWKKPVARPQPNSIALIDREMSVTLAEFQPFLEKTRCPHCNGPVEFWVTKPVRLRSDCAHCAQSLVYDGGTLSKG